MVQTLEDRVQRWRPEPHPHNPPFLTKLSEPFFLRILIRKTPGREASLFLQNGTQGKQEV